MRASSAINIFDWHTLKIVGEAQGKTVFQFCAQYLYYIFEVMLVILIIIYGQKAIETLLFVYLWIKEQSRQAVIAHKPADSAHYVSGFLVKCCLPDK